MIQTFLIAVLIGLIALTPVTAGALAPGDPAPDFLVRDVITDAYFSLSDYQGKVVAMVFFWTG
jgi:hypothetical protein